MAYVRVSTDKQDYALQVDAVKKAGAGRIYQDKLTGKNGDRPGLKSCLAFMRPGDTLVVYALSRLGRSLKDLHRIILEDLEPRGVHFRSLTETIDTSTPMGRFFLTILMALAELERDVLVQRTKAGLEAAKARGRIGGRPSVMSPEKAATARQMLSQGANVATVARVLGVGRASVYRWLESQTDDAAD